MILTGKNHKYLEKHLWFHFVHHRSHTDKSGIEPEPLWSDS